MDDELDQVLREGARPVPSPAAARVVADDVWARIQRSPTDDAPADDLDRRRATVLGELATRRRRPVRVASITLAAVCSWADAWIAADDSGDPAARDAATVVLTAASAWPDIVVNDFPDADYLPDRTGRSCNGWVAPLAEARASVTGRPS